MITELVSNHKQRYLPVVKICLPMVYLIIDLSQLLKSLSLEKRLKLLIHQRLVLFLGH